MSHLTRRSCRPLFRRFVLCLIAQNKSTPKCQHSLALCLRMKIQLKEYTRSKNDELAQRAIESSKSENTNHYLIVYDKTEVGFASIDILNSVEILVLYELYIIKTRRNQGLGASALNYIEELVHSLNLKSIVLTPEPIDSSITKERLINWYRSKGYTIRPEHKTEMVKIIATN